MTKLNIEQMKKAQDLKKLGFSYREIARLMKKNVRQIHRWIKEYVDTYPQQDDKGVDSSK